MMTKYRQYISFSIWLSLNDDMPKKEKVEEIAVPIINLSVKFTWRIKVHLFQIISEWYNLVQNLIKEAMNGIFNTMALHVA